MISDQSISSTVLPGREYQFRIDIDLMDESLREGAERATVPPTLAEKCDLAEAITACGVRSLVVGMFPDVPHNIEFLADLCGGSRSGAFRPMYVSW
jgi:isopropylmalate/homocitrate/citramalate synthase